jgi:ubiquinone/menaquinone biosynthesis C-methylase UbiE
MRRIPEPELMRGQEQARAYAEADFEQPHSFIVDLLRRTFPELPAEGTALDLGCGPADITLRFAWAFPRWRVDGIDGSEAMLRYGRRAVSRAGLSNRIRLILATLPMAGKPNRSYDFVFSTSLLHHLADPKVLWSSVRRWASPRTPVFVTDLMRPVSEDQAKRLVEKYCRDEPAVLQRDFFNSLLASYRIEEVRTQLLASRLGHFEVRPASDRHLIAWGWR